MLLTSGWIDTLFTLARLLQLRRVSVAFQVGPAEKVPEDSVQLEDQVENTWSFSAWPQPWQCLGASHREEKRAGGRGGGAFAAQDQFEAAAPFCHPTYLGHPEPGRDDAGAAPAGVVALQHPSLLPSDGAQTPCTCQRRAAQLGLGAAKAGGQLDDESRGSSETDVELVDGQPEQDEKDGEADWAETSAGSRQVALL